MVKMRKGATLDDFHAGDNQRIFCHKGQIEVREKLPALGPAEDFSPTPPPRDMVHPRVKGFREMALPSDASVFADNGNMIFLNCGDVDRAYGYYADKLIDHRQFVREYRDRLPPGTVSGVTEKTHTIKVKSFEVCSSSILLLKFFIFFIRGFFPMRRELALSSTITSD